jgi:hypothetical protein
MGKRINKIKYMKKLNFILLFAISINLNAQVIFEKSVPLEYGLTSAVLNGVNISTDLICLTRKPNPNSEGFGNVMGITSGVLQTLIGTLVLFNHKDESLPSGNINSFSSSRNLSYINIGVGLSTIIINAWRLSENNKAYKAQQKTSYNINPIYTPDNNSGLALTFNAKF